MSRIGLLLLTLLTTGSAFAANFYKWVDGNGITHYSAEPPPQGKADTVDVQLTPSSDAPEAATSGPASPNGAKPVVIYTAEWCGVCKSAKRYFREHNVAYTEYDVERSAKGAADYRNLKGRGVPIVMVGDARMDGFSPGRFEHMMRGN